MKSAIMDASLSGSVISMTLILICLWFLSLLLIESLKFSIPAPSLPKMIPGLAVLMSISIWSTFLLICIFTMLAFLRFLEMQSLIK